MEARAENIFVEAKRTTLGNVFLDMYTSVVARLEGSLYFWSL